MVGTINSTCSFPGNSTRTSWDNLCSKDMFTGNSPFFTQQQTALTRICNTDESVGTTERSFKGDETTLSGQLAVRCGLLRISFALPLFMTSFSAFQFLGLLFEYFRFDFGIFLSYAFHLEPWFFHTHHRYTHVCVYYICLFMNPDMMP